jgi:hypothetical protein
LEGDQNTAEDVAGWISNLFNVINTINMMKREDSTLGI